MMAFFFSPGLLGGAVCGSFVVFGVLSVILYKPWRRRFDARRNALQMSCGDESGMVLSDLDGGAPASPVHGMPEIIQPTSLESKQRDVK